MRMLTSQYDVVFMALGTRGDVQSMLQAGKLLQNRLPARVRIATHPDFQELVQDAGLEFYSVGGDPNFMMEFWLTTWTSLPGFLSMRSGKIRRMRQMIQELLSGYWRACVDMPGPSGGDDSTHDEAASRPFVADMIVANVPNRAHIHCAERLGIPLLLLMAQPQAPTRAFFHIHSKRAGRDYIPSMGKYLSHVQRETIIWLGVLSSINSFREKELGLARLPWISPIFNLKSWGAPQIALWSDIIAPKPLDWGPEIKLAAYSFMAEPRPLGLDPQLHSFIRKGPPPVYISFGCMPVRDPERLTALIFKAVGMCGVRAIISRGKAIRGRESSADIPTTIYIADDIPHSALLPHVSAMVHHGGAGTVAIQLLNGVPALIVPFIGGQYFWANRLFSLGLTPKPIPISELTADNLAEALLKLFEPGNKYRTWTREVGSYIANQPDGAKAVADFCQAMAKKQTIVCSLHLERMAVWKVKGQTTNLSASAAYKLVTEGKLQWGDLDLLVRKEWNLVWWWARYIEKISQLVVLLLLLWSVGAGFHDAVKVGAVTCWFLSTRSRLGVRLTGRGQHYSFIEDRIRQARINQGRFDLEMIGSKA